MPRKSTSRANRCWNLIPILGILCQSTPSNAVVPSLKILSAEKFAQGLRSQYQIHHAQQLLERMKASKVPKDIENLVYDRVFPFSLSTGNETTCTLTLGVILCSGNLTSRIEEKQLPRMVSAGGDHACLLNFEGQVKCWGRNGRGQLGIPPSLPQELPTSISGLPPNQIGISVGDELSCAWDQGGNAWCWGAHGLKENPYEPTNPEATRVPGVSQVLQVSAGHHGACAITEKGEAWCWGSNTDGQLGTGDQEDVHHPTHLSSLEKLQSISMGDHHACAATTSGQVWCWGNNVFGQLGQPESPSNPHPQAVPLPEPMVAVAVGSLHSCSLSAKGEVWCWGSNRRGQLGDHTAKERHLPATVSGIGVSKALSAGSTHTCTRDQKDQIWCWGTSEAIKGPKLFQIQP